MSKAHVYRFGPGMTDGDAEMKNLLGGKGANLAEMAILEIPVPPGCTITTEICTYYNEMRPVGIIPTYAGTLLKDCLLKSRTHVQVQALKNTSSAR